MAYKSEHKSNLFRNLNHNQITVQQDFSLLSFRSPQYLIVKHHIMHWITLQVNSALLMNFQFWNTLEFIIAQ